MTLAKFYSGSKSSLDTKDKEDGSIYFATDSKEIVVDVPDGERTVFSQVLNHQEISKTEVDDIFAKYNFTERGEGEGISFPIPIEQGGTNANNAAAAWQNLGGGSVGKINLPDSVEGKCLTDDGSWQKIQSSNGNGDDLQELRTQFQDLQLQVNSTFETISNYSEQLENIKQEFSHLNDMDYSLDNRIQTLESIYNALFNDVSQMREELSGMQMNVNQMQMDLSQTIMNLEQIQMDISNLQGMQSQVDSVMGELSMLQDRVMNLEQNSMF